MIRSCFGSETIRRSRATDYFLPAVVLADLRAGFLGAAGVSAFAAARLAGLLAGEEALDPDLAVFLGAAALVFVAFVPVEAAAVLLAARLAGLAAFLLLVSGSPPKIRSQLSP